VKLTDLNPVWSVEDETPDARGFGVIFDCPPCQGTSHEHTIFMPFSNPIVGHPQGYRTTWSRSGTTFGDLTLTPSVRSLRENCGFHAFITQGEVVFCGDSPRPKSEKLANAAAPPQPKVEETRMPEPAGTKLYNSRADAQKDMQHAVKIDKTSYIAQIYLNNTHQFAIRVGHDKWFAGEGKAPAIAKHAETPQKK
jgi:hypothetical protein